MGMEDIRIGLEKNDRQRPDEKDEGVQHDGCAIAMCVIKARQRLVDGDDRLEADGGSGFGSSV